MCHLTKNSKPYKLSGKAELSMASCISIFLLDQEKSHGQVKESLNSLDYTHYFSCRKEAEKWLQSLQKKFNKPPQPESTDDLDTSKTPQRSPPHPTSNEGTKEQNLSVESGLATNSIFSVAFL